MNYPPTEDFAEHSELRNEKFKTSLRGATSLLIIHSVNFKGLMSLRVDLISLNLD